MKKYGVIFYVILFPLSIYPITLTKEQKKIIGNQIWRNEGGGKHEMLVFWNPKEAFPSLGIGHFIWYPAGHTDTYTQTFPLLLDHFTQNNIHLPQWLIEARKTGAPWKNYEDFKRQSTDIRITELRKLLADTIDLQIDFIIKRLDTAWDHMQKHIDPTKKDDASRSFTSLKQTPAGLYALIDYLNFKGEGINPHERYNGKGWGLLQVLEAMPERTNSITAFIEAADHILKQRVQNAPTNKAHEQKWLAGWQSRLQSYKTLFKST